MPEPRVPLVTLGRTGLVTSKLSLGTYGWGGAGPPQVRVEGDARILSLLRAAFALGIRFLNTAEAYQNEAILGRLLPEAGAPPDLLIATTFGHGKGFSADQFRASAERSLRELRLERLPLMFVHDPRTEDDMRVVLGRGGSSGADVPAGLSCPAPMTLVRVPGTPLCAIRLARMRGKT